MVGGMPFVLILGPTERHKTLLHSVQSGLKRDGNITLIPDLNILRDSAKMSALIIDADRVVEVVVDEKRDDLLEANHKLVQKHLTSHEVWHFIEERISTPNGNLIRNFRCDKVEQIL